jgi:hypothetical protein
MTDMAFVQYYKNFIPFECFSLLLILAKSVGTIRYGPAP